MTVGAAALAAEVRSGLAAGADPEYVAGTVIARRPGKQVLGVRIPLLRDAVREPLRRHRPGRPVVLGAADLLWFGAAHEEELAAAMMLRLAKARPTGDLVRRWAPLLDNWLSVDELGGGVGEALLADPALLDDLAFLAGSASPWQRRLYVVALIRPIRDGLDPVKAGRLVALLTDGEVPVRKAAAWLISTAIKARPDAAAQFAAVWPATAPAALTRLIDR
jgi:hypothetical protein